MAGLAQNRSMAFHCPVCDGAFEMDDRLANMHLDLCLSKQNKKTRAISGNSSEVSLADDFILSNNNQSTIVEQQIPGLFLLHNFITEQEEQIIVDNVDNNEITQWKPSSFNGQCMSKVYGVRTQFGLPKETRLVRENNIENGELDIPSLFLSIIQRVADLAQSNNTLPVELRNFKPNDCNANSYLKSKGDYLRPHFDDRALSGPLLLNLSLLSDCTMTYSQPSDPTSKISILLPRRCLQIVSGAARWDYMHGIEREGLGDGRRVSITFRMSGSKRGGVRSLPEATSSINRFLVSSSAIDSSHSAVKECPVSVHREMTIKSKQKRTIFDHLQHAGLENAKKQRVVETISLLEDDDDED